MLLAHGRTMLSESMLTTTKLSARSLTPRLFTLLVLLCALVASCRDETPQKDPKGDSAVGPSSTETTPTPDTATTSGDTAVAGVPEAEGPHAITSSTGAPAWSKRELVDGVGRFMRSIDSNDRSAFFASLSSRSKAMMASDRTITEDRLWEGARATLGDIQNRRIEVVGGSRDSVALEITGKRMVDGQRVDDPVVIQLLRESGSWKVMYPGLLYPGHILHR